MINLQLHNCTRKLNNAIHHHVSGEQEMLDLRGDLCGPCSQMILIAHLISHSLVAYISSENMHLFTLNNLIAHLHQRVSMLSLIIAVYK